LNGLSDIKSNLNQIAIEDNLTPTKSRLLFVINVCTLA